MSNLTIYHIKGLIDLKDTEVFAYFKSCRDQLGDEKLSIIQTHTTSFAQHLAAEFLNKYELFLANDNHRKAVFKYLQERGTEKQYSGKRFSEEFYKLLITFEKSLKEDERETEKDEA